MNLPEQKFFRVTIVGTSPLLLAHNVAGMAGSDEYRRMRELLDESKRQKKSPASLEAVARHEFECHLYYDEILGVVMPYKNLRKCLIEGARKAKQGRDFASCVSVLEGTVQIDHPRLFKNGKPLSVDELYANQDLVSREGTKNKSTGAQVTRVRPKIPAGWRMTFHVEMDGDAPIKDHELKAAIIIAGRQCGLGDWRPSSPGGGRHGRFALEGDIVLVPRPGAESKAA